MTVAFKPRRNASRDTAMALNKLTMQILHANMFRYVQMLILADVLIQDRGYFDVRMDFTDHLQGEVKITAVDPTTVVLDPDAKEHGPDTWNEVTVTRWMSLDEVVGLYGRAKADALEDAVASSELIRYDSVRFEETSFGSQDTGYHYPHWGSRKTVTSARCG